MIPYLKPTLFLNSITFATCFSVRSMYKFYDTKVLFSEYVVILSSSWITLQSWTFGSFNLTFWYPIWLLKSYRKPISRPNYSVEVFNQFSGNRNSPGFKPKSHFIARQQYQSVKIEKDSSASIKIEKGEFSFDFIDKGGKISEDFFLNWFGFLRMG